MSGRVDRREQDRGSAMSQTWEMSHVAKYGALAFVVYKLVEMGPYESALLAGRCLHVFVVAVQGYL